jgi:cytochrome P450 monooxygenase
MLIWTAHRLYPNGVLQVRQCVRDSRLPVGGGKNCQSPMFVQKGDVIHVTKSVLHRDPDIWGEDAEEFRPERWEGLRPMWNFVPFGGGPRRCPAQIMVTVEASYIVARFARLYKTIESREPKPYTAVMRVGPSSLHGVKIAVTAR